MSTAITGTIVSTVDVGASGDFSDCVPALSPNEQYVYLGTTNFGDQRGVIRVPLANFTAAAATLLYPLNFWAAKPIWLFCSADGATIYAGLQNGDIQSAAADGSSGSATTVYPGGASGFPLSGFYSGSTLYFADGVGKGIRTIDIPGNVTTTLVPFVEFTGALGPCRYAADRIMVGGTGSNPGYVCEYGLTTGHRRALAGNGTQGDGFSTGAAFSVKTDGTIFISSDDDGRVYYAGYSLINGTVAAIPNMGNYTVHAPTANVLISGAGSTFNKLS